VLLPHPLQSYISNFAIVTFFIFLLLSPASSRADQLSTLVWNCWVGEINPLKLNCIHERGKPLPKTAPEDTDIELEKQLTNQLREKSLSGDNATLEGVEWKNIKILHSGVQWSIHVAENKSGAKSDQNMIVKIGTGILCPSTIPCSVKIHQPTLKEKAEQSLK
jgi:hypothetical protein